MQDRPTSWELLDAVAELLEETLMPATEGGVRHQARVAANLCRIVQREIAAGAELDLRENELLTEALGQTAPQGADSLTLNRELQDRLLAGDTELEGRAWQALLEIVRGKLTIAKPGYDDYDFGPEIDQ